ncbi:MAG: ABC transporter permease [Acidobacteriota bacterium]
MELRDALRSLRRHPGFTAVVVGTLGLGLAANTTIFSLVHGVLLRPLPYADPERLAMIWGDLGDGAQSLPVVHLLDYHDYRRKSVLFEDFAAATTARFVGADGVLSGDGEPEKVELAAVTANFFPLLGIDPARGRHFVPGEDVYQGPKLVWISHELWQRRYGGDAALLGQTIRLDGFEHEVVGILPAGFRLHLPPEAFGLKHSDVWMPMQVDEGDLPPRNYTGYTVFGRLKDGVTWQQAGEEMAAIAADLRAEHAVHAASNLRIRAVPLHHDVVKAAGPALWALFGAVGFLLLIVCVNVTNLLLMRGAGRRRELAIRAALGADRSQVVRRLLAESLLLATLGGALALLLARGGLALLRWLQPASLPRLDDVHLDLRVVLFTVGIALLTAIVSGLAPAAKVVVRDLAATLREGGRTAGGRDARRLRALLVVGELSLSLVLLIGVGLMIRSFVAIERVQPGFEPAGALTFRLDLPRAFYAEGEDRKAFWDSLEEGLRALPGVREVGAISQLPLTGSGSLQPYAFDAETARNWEQVTADGRSVRPGYFAAMGMQLVAGRPFAAYDLEPDLPQRILIDVSLARHAFGGESPIGQRLQVEPSSNEDPFAEVVGVIAHPRIHDLTQDVRPQIYRPSGGRGGFWWVVRGEGDPALMAASVRRVVADLDRRLPITELRPFGSYVEQATAPFRFSLLLLTLFGGLALLLACLGIYGVISHSVGLRNREFAIRLALGDRPAGVTRLILLQGLRLLAAGTVLGLVAAAGLTGALAGHLYGVSATDPLTWVAVSAVLGLVALTACYLPARRAARTAPSLLLRSD